MKIYRRQNHFVKVVKETKSFITLISVKCEIVREINCAYSLVKPIDEEVLEAPFRVSKKKFGWMYEEFTDDVFLNYSGYTGWSDEDFEKWWNYQEEIGNDMTEQREHYYETKRKEKEESNKWLDELSKF